MQIPILMTRRSPFQEGEGGLPQVNHSNLLPLHNEMGVGSPGQPPQPPTPIQSGADVGYLINTSASGLCLGAP